MRNRENIFARTFFTLFLTILGTSRLPAESAEPELMRLEQVWNDAHLRADGDALDRLWDDQIIVIVPKMKLINKADGLEMFRASRMKFLRYETSDLSTRTYGDTAIVTGRLLRTRKMNDREMQDNWRFTKVYVLRGGQWRVILWQASDWPS
jgi:ketosteroid isomerase-like protein